MELSSSSSGVAMDVLPASYLPNGVHVPNKQLNGMPPPMDESSSESDTLVIDETATNPYFSQSLFELSQQHLSPQKPNSDCVAAAVEPPFIKESAPKLFLCSACGVYFHNWNLYLHMFEEHKRFICLYCLGLFSVIEDLCTHLRNRHNVIAGHRNTPSDFFAVYNEPCFIMCCECNKTFNEQENYFHHTCAKQQNKHLKRLKSAKRGKKLAQNFAKSLRAGGVAGSTAAGGGCGAGAGSPPFKGFEKAATMDNEAFLLFCRAYLGDVKATDPPVNGHANDRLDEEDSSVVESEHVTNSNDSMQETRKVPKLSLKLPPGGFPTIEEEDDAEDDDDDYEEGAEAEDEDEDDDEDEEEEAEEEEEEEDEEEIEEDEECAADENGLVDQQMDSNSQPDGEEFNESNHRKVDWRQPYDYGAPADNIHAVTDTAGELKSQFSGDSLQSNESSAESAAAAALAELNMTEHIDGKDAMLLSGAKSDSRIQIAGSDVAIVDIKELEMPLDKYDVRLLLKRCLAATASTCIYCNHARKIAVNAKQLGLHAIAEHRYVGVVQSITAEELIPESFVHRIQSQLDHLEQYYVSVEPSNNESLDSTADGSNGTCAPLPPPQKKMVFECFQCRFITNTHKELYLHNRKLHTKNMILCIMCKLNFYSYSELICHLCPGVYILNYDVHFHCCWCRSSSDPILCSTAAIASSIEPTDTVGATQEESGHDDDVGDDLPPSNDAAKLPSGAALVLPSAFRLMVHLRKRHHCCDVCLELCDTQLKLSNHVWKHKLHHFCYRCGIAYRNKPDITKHLFWKHGTESVQCKRCLQKKWPHVYHFCTPTNTFACDECSQSFTRAVALKVHKRFHTNTRPHLCGNEEFNCEERFVSKRLLSKHQMRHDKNWLANQASEEMVDVVDDVGVGGDGTAVDSFCNGVAADVRLGHHTRIEDTACTDVKKDPNSASNVQPPSKETVKPKVDLYDLPALNLSESDSSSESDQEDRIDETASPIAKPDKDDTTTTEIFNDAELSVGRDAISRLLASQLMGPPNTSDVLEDNAAISDIWADFKTYQANKEKQQVCGLAPQQKESTTTELEPGPIVTAGLTEELALRDHDYCGKDVTFTEVEPDLGRSVDHDYCTNKDGKKEPVQGGTITATDAQLNATQSQSNNDVKNDAGDGNVSDSSSSSSSSCTCGSNCSCSSTSGSSGSSSNESSTTDSASDSSTEEGRRKQQQRREKRRQKKRTKHQPSATPEASSKNTESTATNSGEQHVAAAATAVALGPPIVAESDLDTTESETDEEFYDRQPQLFAKKIMEEKRNQLLADLNVLGGSASEALITNSFEHNRNGALTKPSTDNSNDYDSRHQPHNQNVDEQEHQQQHSSSKKKRSKSKKKKKRKEAKRLLKLQQQQQQQQEQMHQLHQQHQFLHRQSTIANPVQPPITLTLSRTAVTCNSMSNHQSGGFISSDNTDLRASKRRRVPNKFYGYSSDEDEADRQVTTKWAKTDAFTVRSTSASNAHVPTATSVQIPSVIASPPPPPPPPPPNLPPAAAAAVMPPMHTTPIPIAPTTSSPRSYASSRYSRYQHQRQQQQQLLQQQQQQQLLLQQQQQHQMVQDAQNRNTPGVNPNALYCYCKCPYDEVSEMIGCDAKDCAIEWFHFECVGIMVPPKGHWYCPECRKKRQQKRELLLQKVKQQYMGNM